jgi:hypothetical protein
MYVRWDMRRLNNAPVVPADRSKMERGYKPMGIAKWQVYLGLGCIAGLLAFNEWYGPSRPPFSGRWSVIQSLAFEVLGSNGLLAIYSGACALLLLAAVVSFRRGQG